MSYYGSKDYSHNDDFVLRIRDLRKGNLDLGWLAAGTEQIKVNQANPKRGLTYLDIDQGSYGYTELDEIPRGPRGATPRGAAVAAVLRARSVRPATGPCSTCTARVRQP